MTQEILHTLRRIEQISPQFSEGVADLRQRTETLLEEGKLPEKVVDTIFLNGLELDPEKHSVKLNGNKIPFTPKEFSIIWELAANYDELVTRGSLVKAAWEEDFDFDECTLTYMRYCIGRIRNKLQEEGSNLQILIQWGVGYRLTEVPRDE